MNSISRIRTFSIISKLATICLIPAAGFASDFDSTGKYLYSVSGSEVTIESYSSYDEIANIPTTIEGKNVTKIGMSAFMNCDWVTEVKVPSTVEVIDWAAFKGCTGLIDIALPGSLTRIGLSAFEGCTGLYRMKMPSGVTTVEAQAFRDCINLEELTISSSLTLIEAQVFAGCEKLTEITIPDGILNISFAAFEDCKNIKSLTLPPSVKKIGDFAFRGCSSLEGVIFLGDAPTSGMDIFGETAERFRITCYPSGDGFTFPTWLGYPISVLTKAEIVVNQPMGTNLVDGASKGRFGTVAVGKTGAAKVYTIKNTGFGKLTGLEVSKSGTHGKDFIITQPAKRSLAKGEKTTFTVKFKPSRVGTRKAEIHIKSNDSDENPFDISISGDASAK